MYNDNDSIGIEIEWDNCTMADYNTVKTEVAANIQGISSIKEITTLGLPFWSAYYTVGTTEYCVQGSFVRTTHHHSNTNTTTDGVRFNIEKMASVRKTLPTAAEWSSNAGLSASPITTQPSGNIWEVDVYNDDGIGIEITWYNCTMADFTTMQNEVANNQSLGTLIEKSNSDTRWVAEYTVGEKSYTISVDFASYNYYIFFNIKEKPGN